MIRVKATAKGYYGQLREPGDVFAVKTEREVSSRWMERLDPPAKGKGKAADKPADEPAEI